MHKAMKGVLRRPFFLWVMGFECELWRGHGAWYERGTETGAGASLVGSKTR